MRRRDLLLALAATIAALAYPCLGNAAGTIVRARSLDAAILSEANAVRARHGLTPVSPSASLTRAALVHSVEMARHGYFGHRSSDGTAFWRRIEESYPFTSVFRFWAVGENLAWSVEDLSARKAIRLWLASPRHRKLLLSAKWREAGVSAIKGEEVEGFYGGRDVVIVTMDFGVRR